MKLWARNDVWYNEYDMMLIVQNIFEHVMVFMVGIMSMLTHYYCMN